MRRRALRKFGHAAILGKTTDEYFVFCKKYCKKTQFKIN
jgi:hypothetical protein